LHREEGAEALTWPPPSPGEDRLIFLLIYSGAANDRLDEFIENSAQLLPVFLGTEIDR
jgi:hypothetical protein